VKALRERGFNVVTNSRKMSKSTVIAASNQVALVDGHVGEPATAAEIVGTALARFNAIDMLVNNESLSPMGRPSTVRDIADAVMYLADAAAATGHILYVDGGSHFGRW